MQSADCRLQSVQVTADELQGADCRLQSVEVTADELQGADCRLQSVEGIRGRRSSTIPLDADRQQHFYNLQSVICTLQSLLPESQRTSSSK